MRNYITLNGKNSNEINGLLIQELSPISKPQIRTEVEEIDGRDGDIVTKLGFAAYDKEFTVGLYKDFDINAIIAYFNSEGTVVFSNEPDKYYNYQIIDQIDFERLVRYRTATVRMHCQPFKYSNTEGARTLGNKGTASGEGSFITLDNTPEAQFSKIEPKGNATQTTYSGKNLLNTNALDRTLPYTTTSNGITFKLDSDGSITMNGTNSGGGNSTFTIYSSTTTLVLSGGSYTGDLNPEDGVYRAVSLVVYDGAHFRGFKQASTQTLDASNAQAYLQVVSGDTTNFSNYKIYPMLESGTTKSAYEPYVGGTASPNPDYSQEVNTVTGEQTVKITGRNLFDIARKTGSTTMGGLSIEVLDYSSIRVNGTVSSTSWCELMMPTYFLRPIGNTTTKLFELDPTKKYTLSAKVASGTWTPANTGSNLYVQTSASNTQRDTILNGTPKTFTGADGIYRGWMRFLQDDVFNDAVLTFQLEEESQATEYEAFGSKYTIFLPPDTLDYMIEQGGFTGQGLNVVEQNRIRTKYYIPVEPNTQYTMSVSSWNTSIGSGLPQFSVSYYSTDDYTTPRLSNKDWTAFSTPATFTTPADCHFVRVLFNIGGYLPITPADMTGIKIRGGNLTPIELAKIGNYQDRIYKNEGKWYIEKQVGKSTYDGTEAGWSAGADNRMFFRNDGIYGLAEDNDTIGPVMSNYFTANTYTHIYSGDVDYGIAVAGSTNRMAIRNKDCADKTAFLAWLGAHPTTVYYALATPTTTEITNEALIAQLDALEQAHAYKGRTHIAAIAQGSNAPHIIEAEVQRSSDGNITNNGNIVSKPTLTIYGSGNIGVSLNGYQILEITLGDEEYITIDTAAMEAYKDTLDNLKNRLVNGDYSKFALRPGSNMIEFSGIVSKCVISKYSRWL